MVTSFTFSRKLMIGLESSGSESTGRVDEVFDLSRLHEGSGTGRSVTLEDVGASFSKSELRSLFLTDTELGF